MADSLPTHRLGSPWQRTPGPRAWLSTLWSLLRRPRASWREVRLEHHRSMSLLITNLVAATLLATAALAPWKPPIRYMSAFSVTYFLLILALSTIEYAGIRFLGKQHAYRITPLVAFTTCSHASAGWLISGLAMALVAQIARRIVPLWNSLSGLRSGGNNTTILFIAAMLFAFVVGMMAYSILCGLGYRALRYANS